MQGIIAVNESRENINAMAEKYQEKYKECLKAQDDIDRQSKISKWGVNIGGVFCRFGLLFTSPVKRFIGNILIDVGKPILKWKMDRDAERKKDEIEKEKEKISAMFIADDGSIKEFMMMDDNTAENYYQENFFIEEVQTKKR